MRSIALQRYVMCRALSGLLPLYIVTAYPKSGGTWVSQILSGYLGLPFPRNRRPPLRSCVMQGHYLPAPGMRNVVCVLRDGRDAVVSAYYHYLFKNDRVLKQGTGYLVNESRGALGFDDFDDIHENLPVFIDYLFTTRDVGPFRFRWDEFVYAWRDQPVPTVRYEDMLENPIAAMTHIVRELVDEPVDRERLAQVAARFSFERQSGRRRGVENNSSYLRKGVAGEWHRVFSRSARERFAHHAGAALIVAGYETDDRWVDGQG